MKDRLSKLMNKAELVKFKGPIPPTNFRIELS